MASQTNSCPLFGRPQESPNTRYSEAERTALVRSAIN